MKHSLTTSEACDYLSCAGLLISDRSLRRMAEKSEIYAMKVNGCWVFPRDVLDVWVKSKMSGNVTRVDDNYPAISMPEILIVSLIVTVVVGFLIIYK